MRILHEAPDPNALFYTRTRENGNTEVATIISISFRGPEAWEALFMVPGQAPETITQYNSPLGEWKAVYAVTTDVNGELIERIAQRVVEILNEEDEIEPGDIVESAMDVLEEETVADAVKVASAKLEKQFICDDCGKAYIYEKALKSHKKRIHAVAS